MRKHQQLVAVLAIAAACNAKSGADFDKTSAAGPAPAPAPAMMEDTAGNTEAYGGGALEEGKIEPRKDKAERVQRASSGVKRDGAEDEAGDMDLAPEEPAPPDAAKPAGANRPEGLTRAWFPETFLFAPLVVTDATGAATVPVRVPDRLTTWHVLALAHSRSGAQGGAVTSFLGTLPTYVDPIAPARLVVGDDVRIPIQLVNTTPAPIATTLAVTAERGELTAAGGARTIPANGSRVEYVRLRATKPGTIELRVALGDTDAIVRTIEVVPAGRPSVTTRTGTLAAPRTLAIAGAPGAEAGSGKVRLRVYPGALALLRSELAVSTRRTGLADDAYALTLAGRAPGLLAALGDTADADALRELSIVTAQRAIRASRTLDVGAASLLAEAALAHADNPVLDRLGRRAVEFLAREQRPDGTFAGGDGWTVQRVLVATAEATRAVTAAAAITSPDAAAAATSATAVGDRQRATGVAVRAAGAFERNAALVEDPYTAAAILAAGGATGAFADALRTRVIDAIETSEDGAKFVSPGDGVLRADGTLPSTLDATAMAVLALAGDPKAPVADLGATLLGSYDPGRGWGDGRTNLIAIRAVLELFKAPLPDRVAITLLMDGAPVATGALTRDNIREVLSLDAPAPGLAAAHEWKIVAEPAVPGLGYALSLHTWSPWTADPSGGGVELLVPSSITAAVGKATPLTITALTPGGLELHVTHALPTGVQVDTASLDALVTAGTISRYETSDNLVELFAPPQPAATVFSATYRAVPTLAGTLHTTESTLSAGGATFHFPPATWTVN
jgi:hypothetical protein